jgi:hypothetical protein
MAFKFLAGILIRQFFLLGKRAICEKKTAQRVKWDKHTAFPAVMKHGRDTAMPCPYGD